MILHTAVAISCKNLLLILQSCHFLRFHPRNACLLLKSFIAKVYPETIVLWGIKLHSTDLFRVSLSLISKQCSQDLLSFMWSKEKNQGNQKDFFFIKRYKTHWTELMSFILQNLSWFCSEKKHKCKLNYEIS